MNSGLAITQRKGFQMTFANGYTVSVQWGPGNYCERNHTEYSAPDASNFWQSKDAEIAAWNKDDVLKFDNGDIVKGHCTPDEVAAFIAEVSAI